MSEILNPILLTGATGFVGSHLTLSLVNNGYDVIILKRQSSDTRRLNSVMDKIKIYNIEEHSPQKIFELNPNIKIVIHAATDYARDNSTQKAVMSNLLFPLEILEAGLNSGIQAFINTDSFFSANARSYSYLTAYALSKKQFKEWGEIAFSHKVKFINLCLQHIYGPQDANDKFIMAIIKECLTSTEDIKLTLGEQQRDFIYIEDVVSAYLTILSNLENISSGYVSTDVGTGQSLSIKEVVETIHKATNSKASLLFGSLPYRDGETMSSNTNNSLLKRLGWRSKWSIEEGIRKTVNFILTTKRD